MNIFDILYQLLRVLGALGLFLFGMKLMSESLQKLAGLRLRNIVKAMIANKYKAIFSGLVITAIIQASSATTVMMVSFVNAGLITLTESIGVMMGANIGTTIKIWFIVGLGLKFNLSLILLPLIGLSLPLLFSKNGLRKSWGEFIMGFSLLFFGIEFLITIIPEIQNNTDLFIFIQHFSNYNFASILLFVLLGMLITFTIQSSSATITFTIIMSLNGLLSYEYAAAMILGENIGTTVTANIAAIIANKSAKKAALAHSLLNITGVIWMLIIFYPFLNLIDWIVVKFGGISPYQNSKYIPIALCFFHTSFNVINTILWIGFIPFMIKILHFIIPDEKKKEKYKLQNINSGLLSTSELSIELAGKELYLLAGMNKVFFEHISSLLMEKEEKKYAKLLQKTEKLKIKIGKRIIGITQFLTSLSQSDFSEKGASQISSFYRIIDNLENTKDYSWLMAELIDNKNKSKIWFTQQLREQSLAMFTFVSESFENLINNLQANNEDISLFNSHEHKIQSFQMQFNNTDEIVPKEVSTEAISIYKQLYTNCEKVILSIQNINILISD
ncbi:MAG: Na/Pi cotransporter family protein [Bacteroidetes bacterium]|nr:Na/Pi cotransporter family protein [Bacteroidota bacterium]